jgi:ectoine hydroxylase-related dioxygenase (phytanoyl-CoA dioxygenase family)
MLTDEQVKFYHDNGYLGLENVVPMAQIEEARRVVGELVEQSRTITSHTAVYDLEPEHSAERPLLRRIKAPTNVHPFFDQLMRSDAILDCLEPLIGPNMRFQGDKLNMKTAAIGSPVEWHQDVAFYPHTNDDLLAVGVALDDCTLENGCLLVIPGSHRGPTLDHHQDGYFVGAISPSREDVDLTQAVPVEVRAGGISIHHVAALHGSAPNTSSRPRRLLLYQYAAADAWPLSGVPDYAAFDSKMVRGEPTREFRQLAHTAVRIPSPNPPRVGSIFELQTQLKETVFASRK